MNKINNILKEICPDLLVLGDYIQDYIISNKKNEKNLNLFSEKDTLLITYPDQFQNKKESNLKSLGHFLSKDTHNLFSHVHILPFYPWTCDDGFGVVDFKKVCLDYGTWDDIRSLPSKTMYDCVFNHVSSSNSFFQKALTGDERAKKMFHFLSETEFEDTNTQNEIKEVVRPRTSPLFTPFSIGEKKYYAWTTFSADQVDTNIANPEMVKYILESFFLYIEQGAKYFRIDAVPFMWKELGTNSSHHPKTHLFIKLLRAIIDELNSDLLLITESNVPHEENITYWGDYNDEAHVIYNFSLAPLILHAITLETSKNIGDWGARVFNLPNSVTYLNFTSTHDGVGLRGLEGLVPEIDVKKMCDHVESIGGVVGKKISRNGEERPYEMNTTWASYLNFKKINPDDYLNLIVNSHALAMFYPGIGAHYVHNLFGTKNWEEGFKESGIPRRLNRKKIQYPLTLSDFESECKNKLLELIEVKCSSPAFHPNGSFEVLKVNDKVISFRRRFKDHEKSIHFNLTSSEIITPEMKLAPYELKII
jgi:sucrose phosphorylase